MTTSSLPPCSTPPPAAAGPPAATAAAPATAALGGNIGLDDLPVDLQGVVLAHLSPTDIATTASACRGLRQAARTPSAWQHHLAALPQPLAERWQQLSPNAQWARASGALWGACRVEPLRLCVPEGSQAPRVNLDGATCVALTADAMAVGTGEGDVALFQHDRTAVHCWTARLHLGCVRTIHLPAGVDGRPPEARSRRARGPRAMPLISLGCDGRVQVVDRHNGEVAHSLGPFGHIRLHAFDPSGGRLAAVDGRREVHVLTLSEAGEAPTWAAIPESRAAHVEALAHAHGRLALAYHWHIDIFELPYRPGPQAPPMRRRLTLAPAAHITHLAWQAAQLVAAYSRPGCAYIVVWEAASGARAAHICGPPGLVTSLATADDIAMVGLSDGSLWARDLRLRERPAVVLPPLTLRQAGPIGPPLATARGVALVQGDHGVLMLHIVDGAHRVRITPRALTDQCCLAAVLAADSIAIVEGAGVGTVGLLRALPLRLPAVVLATQPAHLA